MWLGKDRISRSLPPFALPDGDQSAQTGRTERAGPLDVRRDVSKTMPVGTSRVRVSANRWGQDSAGLHMGGAIPSW